MMQEIGQAYSVLSDDAKRKNYDRKLNASTGNHDFKMIFLNYKVPDINLFLCRSFITHEILHESQYRTIAASCEISRTFKWSRPKCPLKFVELHLKKNNSRQNIISIKIKFFFRQINVNIGEHRWTLEFTFFKVLKYHFTNIYISQFTYASKILKKKIGF